MENSIFGFKKKSMSILVILVVIFSSVCSQALAISQDLMDKYNTSQYQDTMHANRDLEFFFTKDDGSEISWDNPLLQTTADQTFGFVAKFAFSNLTQIINAVANGQVSGMPATISSFVAQLNNLAEVNGEIDLTLDLSSGLGTYFSINEAAYTTLAANPDALFQGNSAFTNAFTVASISRTSTAIHLTIATKTGVTGATINALASSTYLTLAYDNLFVLNSSLWGQLNNVNKGEFDRLVEISSPDMVFVIAIPANILAAAQAGGLNVKNPFVGIRLTIDPGYGQMNLGFTVSYEGNGNTSGSAPSDSHSPYLLDGAVTILGRDSLERNGYVFTGWNTLANGSGTSYSTGDSFLIRNNMVLYAQWKLGGAYAAPATGDTSYIELYLYGLMAVVTTLTLIMIIRKKKSLR